MSFNNPTYNNIYNNGYNNQVLPPITNPKRRKKQRLFTKDIETLLYSLGDGPVSTDATINTLEEILVEYLMDLSHKILLYARSQGRSRIKIDDLPFALKNDPLKLSRFLYILEQSSKIEKAKKIFEDRGTNYVEDVIENMDEDEEHANNANNKSEKNESKKKRRKVTGNITLKQNNENDD